jgi:hypothetical protein
VEYAGVAETAAVVAPALFKESTVSMGLDKWEMVVVVIYLSGVPFIFL